MTRFLRAMVVSAELLCSALLCFGWSGGWEGGEHGAVAFYSEKTRAGSATFGVCVLFFLSKKEIVIDNDDD
jgi:hypothetical protein